MPVLPRPGSPFATPGFELSTQLTSQPSERSASHSAAARGSTVPCVPSACRLQTASDMPAWCDGISTRAQGRPQHPLLWLGHQRGSRVGQPVRAGKPPGWAAPHDWIRRDHVALCFSHWSPTSWSWKAETEKLLSVHPKNSIRAESGRHQGKTPGTTVSLQLARTISDEMAGVSPRLRCRE